MNDDPVIPCAMDGCKHPSQMPSSEYCSMHGYIDAPSAPPADDLVTRLRGAQQNEDDSVLELYEQLAEEAAAAITQLREQVERLTRENERLEQDRDKWVAIAGEQESTIERLTREHVKDKDALVAGQAEMRATIERLRKDANESNRLIADEGERQRERAEQAEATVERQAKVIAAADALHADYGLDISTAVTAENYRAIRALARTQEP